MKAGLDFPYYYWRFADDGTFRTDSEYEIGVMTHLLRGEAVYLHSVLRETSPYIERPSLQREAHDSLTSIYSQPGCDYFSLDDPWPFVRDLRNAVAEATRAS